MSHSRTTAVRLGALVQGFVQPGVDTAVDVSVEITGVCLDSRQVCAGDVYLAMAGSTSHGLQFATAALEKGAVAVVTDDAGLQQHADVLTAVRATGVPVLHVPNLKQQAGAIAARFYEYPSKALQVVAVTGTDGKTSVCRFVANALNSTGEACGYIGTLGWGIASLTETELTTPDAVSLQRMMAILRDAGASVVALEASSHGLEEGRLDAVHIDVAVLTNFGRDHLDYHKDLAAYKKAKARLFTWPDVQFVVLNGDDELGRELAEQSSCTRVVFYADELASKKQLAVSLNRQTEIEIKAEAIELASGGLRFDLLDNGARFKQRSGLMGSFNVENLLACHGVLRALGKAANDASASLNQILPVPGRIEQFSGSGKPTAVVDYAHTPQALVAVIGAVRHHCAGDLWVVFGCGGDRDPGKRGPMGVAAEQADHIIVTDDNPRTEQSQIIIDQIVDGMNHPERATVIADRGQAIAHALSNAASNDLVLVAGKGHETYQIIGTQKTDFSDRETVQRFMLEAV